MARAEMRECCGKLTRITDTTNISSFFVVVATVPVVAFKNESKMMACPPPISS